MIFTLLERSHDVKRSKFTEQQIAFALKQAELGCPKSSEAFP
jgi:putative transposase